MEAERIVHDGSLNQYSESIEATQSSTDLVPSNASSKCPVSIVLPQTSKSIRGTYFSPFVRAYVPELANLGIDMDAFVAFIDGLNEAFIANPALEAINIVASVVSILGYVEAVSIAAGGVALGTMAASRASSHFRTKAYLKAVNENLFHPVGLHAKIMKTNDMMNEIGCEGMNLNLPPLETEAVLDEENLADQESTNPSEIDAQSANKDWDDPRMRRVKALEGHVMPLDFDVPPAVSPETLLRRMGDYQAKKLARKQEKKLTKNRETAAEKQQQMLEKAEVKNLESEQKIAKLERKQEMEKTRLESLTAEVSSDNIVSASAHKFKVQKSERTLASLERQISAERDKLETDKEKYHNEAEQARKKPDVKEEKIARKIRWVVISHWADENASDDRSDSSVSISEE